MHDKNKAVEISEDQFKTCQQANGQFCCLKHTSSTAHKHTNVYNSFIWQGQS